jgi:hypothetical protein
LSELREFDIDSQVELEVAVKLTDFVVASPPQQPDRAQSPQLLTHRFSAVAASGFAARQGRPMPTPLFETTAPQPELDPIYVFIRDDPDQDETRGYLEGLWTEYVPYADRNFLDQFQRRGQFHARTWEMRLTVVLKRLGLPFCPRPGGQRAPG